MIKAVQTCLVVIVIYNKGWAEIPSSKFLINELKKNKNNKKNIFSLEKILIYDNSISTIGSFPDLSGSIQYVNNFNNGGTRDAYIFALEEANKCGYDWLLLLDQDTDLPENFFFKTEEYFLRHSNELAQVILPQIYDGSHMVSPSRISLFGSFRGDSCLQPEQMFAAKKGITGIASGSLIAVSAFNRLPIIPQALWLDFVDHWIFLGLNKLGLSFYISGALLRHKLSIIDMPNVGKKRLFSILDGERLFIGGLGFVPRLLYPFRITYRYLKFSFFYPNIAKYMRAWICERFIRGC